LPPSNWKGPILRQCVKAAISAANPEAEPARRWSCWELKTKDPQSHLSPRVTRATNAPLGHFDLSGLSLPPFTHSSVIVRVSSSSLLCLEQFAKPTVAFSLERACPRNFARNQSTAVFVRSTLLEGRPINQSACLAPPEKRTTLTIFFPSTTRSPSPSRPSIRGDAVFSVIIGVCETRSADRETGSEALDQGFSKPATRLNQPFATTIPTLQPPNNHHESSAIHFIESIGHMILA
jgi:hypothetical protein